MKKRPLSKNDAILRRTYSLPRATIIRLDKLVGFYNKPKLENGERLTSESKIVEQAVELLFKEVFR